MKPRGRAPKPPRMRYHGRPGEEPPPLGAWLKSERGRNSYHVIGIKANLVRDDGSRIYALQLERFPAASIPDGADVRLIKWNSSRKRRA